jgi:hypothetical protein
MFSIAVGRRGVEQAYPRWGQCGILPGPDISNPSRFRVSNQSRSGWYAAGSPGTRKRRKAASVLRSRYVRDHGG